jgi:hypothetical protein
LGIATFLGSNLWLSSAFIGVAVVPEILLGDDICSSKSIACHLSTVSIILSIFGELSV